MIRFFKNFDYLQLIFLLIILIIIRIPVFLYTTPYVIQQLDWMLIGERLGKGFMMYRDTYDIVGPFSAFVYYIIDLVAGKSQVAYFVVSTILVFFQALLCNLIFNANNVYKERPAIPALLYIILSSLYLDFYTLSPVLLGTTFLILMLHFLFQQVRSVITEDLMFYTGLCIGLATLFSIEFSIYLVFAFTSTVFFANPDLRKALILLVGFAFPIVFTGIYYFFSDGLNHFVSQYLLSVFHYPSEIFVSFDIQTIILITPVVLLVLSFAWIINNGKYINYQYNIIKIMLHWIVFSVFFLFISLEFSANNLFILIPAFSFFISHLFLLIRIRNVQEPVFWFSTIVILTINYGITFNFIFTKKSFKKTGLLRSFEENEFKNKRILVLGEGKYKYMNNSLGSPYLNWELSERKLRSLESYNRIAEIYKSINSDSPEVIIDEKNVIPAIFDKIPALQKKYVKREDENIYVLRAQ